MKKIPLIFKELALFFLALILVFGIESKIYAKTTVSQKSIISIDSGRKYTSVKEFKKIIDIAYSNGYSGIQINLGNDGLRLLLDDMSIEANGRKYSSESVKKAIQYGNSQYYDDPNGSFLTQSEMNTIVSYAKEKGLEVIPVLNSPGHMDAILKAMVNLGIKHPAFKTSVRTIDLNNKGAINFTQALISKYVAYFSQYSKIFNFGFDEYANDVQNGGGWKNIQETGVYTKFVTYANSLCKIAKSYGLQPMAYNDGIYYNNKTEFGTFDQSLIVSYWTSGWSGYEVAPAEFLVNKGHKILNTNDAWYWVVGRMSATDGGYNFKQASQGIEKNSFTKITGTDKELPTIGSMIGVWSDIPSNVLDMTSLNQLMTHFSQKNQDYFNVPTGIHE